MSDKCDKTKNQKLAHKKVAALGTLTPFYVRCGRQNCRCARDADYRHGPYWYLRKQSQGHRKKSYVPLSKVGVASDAIANSVQDRIEGQEGVSCSQDVLTEMRGVIRQIEREIKGN